MRVSAAAVSVAGDAAPFADGALVRITMAVGIFFTLEYLHWNIINIVSFYFDIKQDATMVVVPPNGNANAPRADPNQRVVGNEADGYEVCLLSLLIFILSFHYCHWL